MHRNWKVPILAVAVLAAVAIGASSASANPAPSPAYCFGFGTSWPGSLYGAGSLAPDNDVRRTWDLWQGRGYDFVRTSTPSWWSSDHVLWVLVRFHTASGGYLDVWHSCSDYRNDYVGGSYTDG